MSKRILSSLLALALVLSVPAVHVLAADTQTVYPEGYRDLWLPEGETPDGTPADNCQWTLTGEQKEETKLTCQKEEHTHSFLCPQDTEGNFLCNCHTQHTEDCYQTLWPDCLEHRHDSSCRPEILYGCGLEETSGHSHDESCLALTCGKQPGEGAHSHSTETCPQEEAQICSFSQEHTHEESCYGYHYICTPPEGEEHTHDTSCIGPNYLCTPQDGEEHIHQESCIAHNYICTPAEGETHVHDITCEGPALLCKLPEHTHDDSCTRTRFLCGCEESEGHVHTDSCRDLICGKEAGEGSHSHENCPVTETRYRCGLEAHSHTQDCPTRQELICGVEDLQSHMTQGCPQDCTREVHTHGDACYLTVTLLEWAVTALPEPQEPETVPTVTVTVRFEENGKKRALAGGSVTLTGPDGTPLTSSTNKSGKAVFRDLAPGKYTASLKHEDDTFVYSCEEPVCAVDKDHTKFALTADTRRLETDLHVTVKLERYLNGRKQAEDFRQEGYSEPRKFTFTLTLTDPEGKKQEPVAKTLDLENSDAEDDTLTFSVPRGYRYKIEEKSGPYQAQLFHASGTMGKDPATVSAVNTFRYYTGDTEDGNNDLQDTLCVQVLAQDPQGAALPDAKFSLRGLGAAFQKAPEKDIHHFCIAAPGTYTLSQTATARGYVTDSCRYKLVVDHEFRETTAKIDGSQVPVILETLHIDKAASTLPKTADGIFTLENAVQLIDVSVTLRWRLFGDVKQPGSGKIGLYLDGELFRSATLTEKDGWKCTWTDLPGNHEYTVNMLSVPNGFKKTIRETTANKWTITCSAYTNPATQDGFGLECWLLIMAASGSLLVGSAWTALKKKTPNL